MTDQELRELVREAITRHGRHDDTRSPAGMAVLAHASHGLFQVAAGGEGDGACLIEPTVRCNHCGYCKSYGH